ncbi:DUF4864 domain-containing protein [Oceanicola sp. S124]|uniref:DUF4864 domain-containing protein n=1 Tax=Oceanicola sp. S124 TaxID=1042378 RepID=UPI00025590F6|nr:DUF4864 domain-containing protein [Oceanicola sp. S124]
MWRVASGVQVALLIAGAASAQEEAVKGVIGAQMEALSNGDFAGAYEMASPGIRGTFGPVENFERMLRQGYPEVLDPRLFRFMGVEARGDRQAQVLLVEDRQGRSFLLEYLMIETPEGWKIDAVRRLPAAEPAV